MKIERLSEKRAVQFVLERFHELERGWNDVERRRRLLRDMRRFLASLNDAKELDDPKASCRARTTERHDRSDPPCRSLWC